MVSPSKPNHSRVATQQQSTNKCKPLKGTRPLLNHKFYLDIEKHHISSKIETKIKELGGSIEFFLDKNVTHFITDRQLDREHSCSSPQTPKTPKTPLTPQTPHTPLSTYRKSDYTDVASPNVGQPNEAKASSSKLRSRADALLQRARVQQQSLDNSIRSTNHQINNQQSPVHLARSWGIPIWTPDYALRFLEKVAAYIKLTHPSSSYSKGKPANLKHLRGDYIKIESFEKHYRPYYKEIKHWPGISLSGLAGDSPFVHHSERQQKLNNNQSNKMTRKSRSKQMRTNKNDVKRSSEKQCGYCEICRVEYDVLSVHLQSTEHLSFVKNDDNFVSLDTLINNGANVDAFLKANEPASNYIDNELFGKRSSGRIMAKLIRACENDVKRECNSDFELNGELEHYQFSPPITRRSRKSEGVVQQREKSKERNVKVNSSPAKIESTSMNARARRETVKRINYDESIEDEENTEEDSDDIVEKKVKKIRLRGIRWRAPSLDDNTTVQQPIVYKVVKDNSQSSTKSSSNKKGPLSEQNKGQAGIKFRICRVRESELARLTNEADHFMFPRVFSDYPTDDDRQSTSEMAADMSTEIVSSEPEKSTQRSAMANNNKTKGIGKKKKRRNQLEAFLDDNSDYYKFEKQDSRLRFQEAPVQPTLIDDRQQSSSSNDDRQCGGMEDRTGDLRKPKFELQSRIKAFKFAFERVPVNESWYETFQRQDEGREKFFEYWGGTSYRKLPYEIGPLPPLSSDCCILSKLNIGKNHKRYKQARKNRGKLPKKLLNTTAAGSKNVITDESNQIQEPSTSNMQRIDDQQNTADLQKIKIKSETIAASKKTTEKTTCLLKNPFASAFSNSSISASTSTSITTGSTKRHPCKKNLSLDFKALNNAAAKIKSEPSGSKSASAITAHKKFSIWDYQPRKSPREHASTLAILSCLVQQRRKKEKELNGGISPKKIQSRCESAPESRCESAPESRCDSDASNSEVNSFNGFSLQDNRKALSENYKLIIKSEMLQLGDEHEISVDDEEEDIFHDALDHDSSIGDNKIANELPKNELTNIAINGSTFDQLSSAINNKIENVKADINQQPTVSEQPINSNGKSQSDTEFKIPKVPETDYADPNQVCRQIDYLLNSAYYADDGLSDIPIPSNCDDLILINSPKDFMEIISSVDPGPLRYGFYTQLRKKHGLSSFVRAGRKRINRTGWPKVPRRRRSAKNPIDDINVDDSYSNSVSNRTNMDDGNRRLTSGNGEDGPIEISQCLESNSEEVYLRSRQKLNSLGEDCSKDDDFSNDCNNSVIFTSSSDKAENSDIFTVSSDSLDTVINETDGTESQQVQEFIAKTSIKNSLTTSDDSSSTDITLAEMLKKQIGVSERLNRKNFPFKSKSKKKKCNHQKGKKRSPPKQRPQLPIMQPIICVKKISESECEMVSSSKMNNIDSGCVTGGGDNQFNSSSSTTITSSPPLPPPPPPISFSPRKLRKPRGRWYRER